MVNLIILLPSPLPPSPPNTHHRSDPLLSLIHISFKFNQYGKSGAWVSDLMPHTSRVVDDLCFIKSMYTEQINHDPALTFLQTGHQLAGRPSMGSWLTYGLGSENENLPSFVVLVSNNAPKDQPLYARLWGNGFLPSRYQGVQLRACLLYTSRCV